jgi:hypothetical protein
MLRELLVIIRIWGLLRQSCLPVFVRSAENLDVLALLFKLLSRLVQTSEPDENLLGNPVSVTLCGMTKYYYIFLFSCVRSGWDSSVGTAAGCVLDKRSSNSGRGKTFNSTMSGPALGPIQRPIEWILEALSLRVKLEEHEAAPPPPSSVDVKMVVPYLHSLLYKYRHGIVFN